MRYTCFVFFFFQAEDGIRYLVRSRGLGDVYKRQVQHDHAAGLGLVGNHRVAQLLPGKELHLAVNWQLQVFAINGGHLFAHAFNHTACLLYTSDAADERSSVDLGGRRIIKKKKKQKKQKKKKKQRESKNSSN